MIPARREWIRRAYQLEFFFIGANRHRCAELGQQRLHVERDRIQRELAGLDLGEIEDIVDQAEQGLGTALDRFSIVVLLAIEVGIE